MKSYMAKPGSVEQKWYLVDAEGMVFGRLASQVASILRGKNKPEFTPHVDTGDFVIIINADKAVFTGNKLQQKCIQTPFRLCRQHERNEVRTLDAEQTRVCDV